MSQSPSSEPNVSPGSDEQASRVRTPHVSMTEAIDRFLDQTAGFHDLIEVVGPAAEQLDARPRSVRSITAALPSVLLSKDRDVVADAMTTYIKTLVEGSDEEASQTAWLEVKGLIRDGVENEAMANYVIHDLVRRFSTRSRRSREFYRASLVSLMTYFESLLSVVFAEYYRHFPNAMGADNKEFSLLDLRKLESIDEAEEVAVSSRVDKLMNGGIGEWIAWFEKTTKKDFQTLIPAHDEFRESWERRNVFVHHGGIVSRNYLTRVPSGERTSVELGHRLGCSPKYLQRKAEVVTTVGLSLAIDIMARMAKNKDSIDGYLNVVAYDLVQARRWEAVELFGPVLQEHLEGSGSQFTMQVNCWLAAKHLARDDWRGEVDGWDVEPLSGRFKFAKACLLDDVEGVVTILPNLLNAGDLGVGDVEHWPLAETVRQDPRIQAMLKQHATSADLALPALESDESEALGQMARTDEPEDFVA